MMPALFVAGCELKLLVSNYKAYEFAFIVAKNFFGMLHTQSWQRRYVWNPELVSYPNFVSSKKIKQIRWLIAYFSHCK